MEAFVDQDSLNAYLAEGSGAFDPAVIADVLTYKRQAQTKVVKALEATASGRYGSGTGRRIRHRTLGGAGLGYSPSQDRRAYARLLYKRIRDADLTDEDNADAHGNVQRAEAMLCLHAALPTLGMRVTRAGGLTNTIGTSVPGRDLMHVRELNKYRMLIYNQALELIKDAMFIAGEEPSVTHVSG